MLAVIAAMLAAASGYRGPLSLRGPAVAWLSAAFLGVGLLDFLHILSYPGPPGASSFDSLQASVLFSSTARLLSAAALLLYIWMLARPRGPASAMLAPLAWVSALVLDVAVLGFGQGAWTPHLLSADNGATLLKTGLDGLVIGMGLASLWLLRKRHGLLSREGSGALGLAIALSTVSTCFLTLTHGLAQDDAAVLGHGYKVAAFLYLVCALFMEHAQRSRERSEMQTLREKLVLSVAPDGVLWVDQEGQILQANPAMEALTGYRATELVGQNVSLFLPAHLRDHHAEAMQGYFVKPHARAMGLMDLKLMRRDGSMLPVDISLGHWQSRTAHYAIAYVRDLTERKKFEESLRHKATHDELTGLPNRWLFNFELEQGLLRAGRSGQSVAVVVLDLDHFKSINDSFGHAMGDALLVQVAARMRGVLRQNDLLARLGGDEFALLLTDLSEADVATRVVAKLQAVLQASYRLGEQDVHSGGSMGLAYYPGDARDGGTLLRYADMAMYQAKQTGRGSYACYSADMDKRARDDMQLHGRLKEALKKGRLQLHYQPQVSVETGAIVGAEALLRWHDELLGQVPPDRFIAVAEATGLILPLSDWVLDTACRQIAAWQRAGTPLRVAINVSPQQFRQRDLPEKIRKAFELSGAQPGWLDIEITESVAMSHPDQAREQIAALVALGCNLALDDFGTGYSSLAYLKALPVSKLKIDKCFMDGVPDDASDVTLSRTIIALAHSMGLGVVAEGIETVEQLNFLRAHGCESYQGWLFGKAMSAEDFTALLAGPPRQLTARFS